MKDLVIPASTEIRQVRARAWGRAHDASFDRCIRAYPASPGVIAVQVRALRGSVPTYATASLTREQVMELRNHLTSLLSVDSCVDCGGETCVCGDPLFR